MPIRKVSGGYKWGNHGKVYKNRKGAERQAAAAHANGFKEEDKLPSFKEFVKNVRADIREINTYLVKTASGKSAKVQGYSVDDVKCAVHDAVSVELIKEVDETDDDETNVALAQEKVDEMDGSTCTTAGIDMADTQLFKRKKPKE